MKIYFGFAIADGMFPTMCTASRRPLSIDEVRQIVADGVIGMINPFHSATIVAMNTRFRLDVEIPTEAAVKVNLRPGDRVIVMSVRGLPRLTESREYTENEIEKADFVFSLWTIHDFPAVQDIVALAAKLPSGLGDAESAEKLIREREELWQAIADGDPIGALTELADAVYNSAKHIEYCAAILGLTVDDAMRLAEAKYSLRAAPGNPKDDEAERWACLGVLNGIKVGLRMSKRSGNNKGD